MSRERLRAWIATAFAFAAAAIILFAGLSSFGIWDPWELNAADEARTLAEGGTVALTEPPLTAHVVAWGFHAFGVHEWAGRVPMGLAGLLALALGCLLVWRFAGQRAGAYTVLVAGTTPIFLFNSRQMLGHAPTFAAQTLLALAAAFAVFLPSSAKADAKRRVVDTALWFALLAGAIALAASSGGVLVGVLPPLVAVAIAAVIDGGIFAPRRDLRRAVAGYVVIAVALVLVGLVVRGVLADQAGYTHWLGGTPRGGTAPTFDRAIDALFHGFAPWSAVLPLALGAMLLGTRAPAAGPSAPASADAAMGPEERSLRLVLVLWATFGYGAETLFESRYGPTTFMPVLGAAAMVALYLRDLERTGRGSWAAGLIVSLLAVLILRDYALYPGTPIEGLGAGDITVPEVFNTATGSLAAPKRAWALLLGVFAALAFMGIGADDGAGRLDLAAPYRMVREQWRKALPYKLWLGFIALLLLAVIVFGVLCALGGERIGLTSIVVKWGKRLLLVPLAVPVGALLAQVVPWTASRLGQLRLWPMLFAAALFGAYAAQGFLPALSAHLSPREVYDTYNAIARPGEPLAEFRVGGRSAAYYARGEVREITSQQLLLTYLREPGRRWAAFPADELPAIDRAFRQATQRHLFVADARSARVVLAANESVAGRENENFLAKYVLAAPPRTQHPVHAMFEDKIELVGYDLELPHGAYVGAGESFKVTWYWRALHPIPGGFQIFLHVDGQGQRLNGDHEAVDGKYPTRLWDTGDVVVDEQTLAVPANYRPGEYTMFIGFYAGETRLRIVEGPKDDSNRVPAGVVRVR
jgi:4-amino-4-deoxy-L-arabinose transferase-like glycosyltransferase